MRQTRESIPAARGSAFNLQLGWLQVCFLGGLWCLHQSPHLGELLRGSSMWAAVGTCVQSSPAYCLPLVGPELALSFSQG